jgi:hypothetical protein
MRQSLDYLFSLQPGTEIASLFELSDQIGQASAHSLDAGESALTWSRRQLAAMENSSSSATDARRRILSAIVDALSHPDDSIPSLLIKMNDYGSRYLAAIMLGWYGSQAQAAIPDLVDLAAGSSGDVGAASASILRIGGAKDALLAELKNSLASAEYSAFLQISELVARGGYDSSEGYTDILYYAARSPDSDIREAAATAIGRLDRKLRLQFMPTLNRLRADPIRNVRDAATEAGERTDDRKV